VNYIYKKSTNEAMANIGNMARDFFTNGKCISCKICEKICPVDNIKMIDGKPSWNWHCEFCMACIQWCPAKAIECGSKTSKRKQYRHPNIKIADMIN